MPMDLWEKGEHEYLWN